VSGNFSLQASCLDGETLTGGGFNMTSTNAIVLQSYPSGLNWVAGGLGAVSGDTLTVYAVCAGSSTPPV
jgi:hypothetical protein